jgi:hypothetical protein
MGGKYWRYPAHPIRIPIRLPESTSKGWWRASIIREPEIESILRNFCHGERYFTYQLLEQLLKKE